MNIPVVAGSISTVLFVISVLPMLIKAAHTKDLSSYSLTNIATSNLANLIHTIYVFNMPIGPIWLLHSFYLIATALMLYWYLRYRSRGRGNRRQPAVRALDRMPSLLDRQEVWP